MKKLLISILWVIPLIGIYTTNATEYSTEMQEAYNRAYQNWIIWESSIDDATLYDALPNPEMRAILLNFAEYLWLDPNLIAKSFGDLFIDEGSFANRANFATALSRILRGDQYDWGNPYYKNHLEALKTVGIINQIDNPENRTEIKWYVLSMLMKATEDYNEIDCNDPDIILACPDSKSNTYNECPEICRPNWILTNNLTKTVEFKSNQNERKTVFDWIYTALKNNIKLKFFWIEDADKFMLDEDVYYFEKRCKKNNTTLKFHLYIDWKENGNWITIDEACQFWFGAAKGVWINEITLNKWESINIKVEAEVIGTVEEEDIYKTQLILQSDDFNSQNYNDTKEDLSPIKIINNSIKCTWMKSAKVSHTIDEDIITLKWNAIEWENVKISIFDPDSESYKILWTVKMSNKKFTYKIKWEWEQNFLLSNWCDNYNYKVNITKAEKQNITSKYWTISIANPDNKNEWITIMDRNLWATSNDINSSNSYWYYYQWWNNYGFNRKNKINTTTDKATRNSKYDNNWYYDNFFRAASRDYWIDWSHNWIRWWEYDSNDNDWWANEKNPYNRQWPCPDGYHIPSAWEWGLLIKYRKNTYNKDVELKWGHWQFSFTDKTATENFSDYFKLPLAGNINSYDGLTEEQGENWVYWSSSINIENEGYAKHLYIQYDSSVRDVSTEKESTLSQVYATAASPRSEGMPIRCFKNSYDPSTKEVIYEENIEEKEVVKKVEEKEDNVIEKEQKDTAIQTTDTQKIEKSNLNPSDILKNGYTREMNEAYKFAHEKWITTTSNIEKAKMEWTLTRIAMAKMLSQYAINVLWKEPDLSKWMVKFNDVTDKQNSDYNNAVTLSYQLWIMWQWTSNFRPNDEVTRGEFATALSRMLYSTPDGNPYYTTHIKKLKEEWIITKYNPDSKEKRWYVMIMLMRTAE